MLDPARQSHGSANLRAQRLDAGAATAVRNHTRSTTQWFFLRLTSPRHAPLCLTKHGHTHAHTHMYQCIYIYMLPVFRSRLWSTTIEIYFYSFSSILNSFRKFFNSFLAILFIYSLIFGQFFGIDRRIGKNWKELKETMERIEQIWKELNRIVRTNGNWQKNWKDLKRIVRTKWKELKRIEKNCKKKWKELKRNWKEL